MQCPKFARGGKLAVPESGDWIEPRMAGLWSAAEVVVRWGRARGEVVSVLSG
jgi:hypothetical protein